jgi:hypothetical protein
MDEKNKNPSATQIVKEIKRRTRRKFTAEEKIKIVLEGMRGEDTITSICSKYAIHSDNYFKWRKPCILPVLQKIMHQSYYQIMVNVISQGSLEASLVGKGQGSINAKPCHPQTQGKIERYHRTMKNVIRLDNYYSPEDLARSVNEFVEHYNYKRYHESLGNITPADVYFGKDLEIIQQRSKIKEKTLYERRQNYIKEKLKLTYEIL